MTDRSSYAGDSRTLERGFTLIELVVGLVLLAVVAMALAMIPLGSQRRRRSTMNQLESAQSASAAMEMIARDVRSAGYGVDLDAPSPQPAITYVDSLELIMSANLQPYPDAVAFHDPP